MNGTPSLRRAVLVLLGLGSLLAMTGCVNLPANTTASVVSNPAKGGSGSDVRIWPQAPRPGATPEHIVEGFLQTAASDPSNLPIAQDYLIGEAQSDWDPNQVVVFSDVSSPVPGVSLSDPGHIKIQITGTEVAKVSDDGAYSQVQNPTSKPYTFDLVMDPVKKYYRIDVLPNDFGILLSQEAFRANYAAYYLYYLSHDKPTSSMIPVPDYQRSQTGDAATAQNLVKALLHGPPDPVAEIASVAVPNVTLAGQVTISPNNTASVPIKPLNNCATQGRRACQLLADELVATLSGLASVSNVTLVDAQGNPLAQSASGGNVASRYHIAVGATKDTIFYYLDPKTAQVDRFDSSITNADPTSAEPVGPATRKYSQIAVGNVTVGNKAPQTYAAVVDDKGSNLYVGIPGLSTDAAPVYTGQHISSLSWDVFGHLWFLDTAGPVVSLFQLDVAAQPNPVLQQVPIAGDGSAVGTIKRVAVAPDGLRLAVSYAGPAGASVAIATVADTNLGIDANLSFGAEKPVVAGWTSVLDLGWHGSQTLAVLGSASASSPETVAELNSDGSPVISAADLNPVTFNPPTGIVAIEWAGSALLAATQSGTGNSAVRQIEQYSFTNLTWSLDAKGFSPTYMN